MATLTRPSQLIMVPGNAVYLGGGDTRDSRFWGSILRGRISEPEVMKEILYYNEHIAAAIEEARLHRNSLLVFSGGKTIPEARFRSEGESYGLVAEYNGWYTRRGVRKRSYAETFSRDSFENLLGGMIVFKQITGEYPREVIVVGFGFKAERFGFHAGTLGVVAKNFHYVVVNNPAGDPTDVNTQLGRVIAGEKRSFERFIKCPYGDSGENAEQKLKRDIFHRGFPYPEVAEILRK